MINAISTEPGRFRSSIVLATIGFAALAGLSFAAVAGWIIHGEAIYRDALASGWSLCF